MKPLIWFWRTAREPRIITAVITVSYLALAVTAALILCDPLVDTPLEALSAVVTLVAALVGTPAAWRGSWWLEGPAAAVVVVGLSGLAASEVIHAAEHHYMPHATLGMFVALALSYAARVLRTWGSPYRPGILDPERRKDAYDRVRAAKEGERKAVEEFRANRR